MTGNYALPSPAAWRRLAFEDKQMWMRRLEAMEAVIGLKHDVRHVRYQWLETERPVKRKTTR